MNGNPYSEGIPSKSRLESIIIGWLVRDVWGIAWDLALIPSQHHVKCLLCNPRPFIPRNGPRAQTSSKTWVGLLSLFPCLPACLESTGVHILAWEVERRSHLPLIINSIKGLMMPHLRMEIGMKEEWCLQSIEEPQTGFPLNSPILISTYWEGTGWSLMQNNSFHRFFSKYA